MLMLVLQLEHARLLPIGNFMSFPSEMIRTTAKYW